MKPPSTQWREVIPADEAARFARHAETIRTIQARASAKFGVGRSLHRRQLLAARAQFEILDGLPPHAKHGLFAKPGMRDVAVRLSNGSMAHQPDAAPDIRGFAFRVEGVDGPGALGIPTTSQTFALVNQSALMVTGSDEFVAVVEAVSRGNLALLVHLFRTFGPFGALKKIKALAGSLARPFSGFATEPFHSGAPIACGPYAAKVRLLPPGGPPTPGAKKDWAGDMRARLAAGPLVYTFQLQFFVDEAITPIETPAVDWPEAEAPFVTVARLTLPQQKFDTDAARNFADAVEASRFDPWGALMEHRPLGEIMRARKAAYLASQQGRNAK